MEPFYVLLLLLRRMLQHCLPVKLQNFFANYKTNPNFYQHGGEQIMTECSLLGDFILESATAVCKPTGGRIEVATILYLVTTIASDNSRNDPR